MTIYLTEYELDIDDHLLLCENEIPDADKMININSSFLSMILLIADKLNY